MYGGASEQSLDFFEIFRQVRPNLPLLLPIHQLRDRSPTPFRDWSAEEAT